MHLDTNYIFFLSDIKTQSSEHTLFFSLNLPNTHITKEKKFSSLKEIRQSVMDSATSFTELEEITNTTFTIC